MERVRVVRRMNAAGIHKRISGHLSVRRARRLPDHAPPRSLTSG